MKNKFRIILYVICVILLIISSVHLIKYYYIQDKENELIEKVQMEKQISEKKERVEENTSQKDILQETMECGERTVLPIYESMYNENNDLYGWIEIKNTQINYPVMYTPNVPNFYINKDWNKETSKSGSIYVDSRCGQDSENLIIYGHNMNDFSMFGSLSYYTKKSYYEEHKYIEFDTIYEKSKYEIIAVSQAFIKEEDMMPSKEGLGKEVPFKQVIDDEYLFYEHLEFKNKEEFDEYVNWMKQNSYYEINSTANYGERIITLCTCVNIKKYQNERLLIIAKKIE